MDGTVTKVVPFGKVDAYVATTSRGTAGPMTSVDRLKVGDKVVVGYDESTPEVMVATLPATVAMVGLAVFLILAALVGVVVIPGRPVGRWYRSQRPVHNFRLARDKDISVLETGHAWLPSGVSDPRLVYVQEAGRYLRIVKVTLKPRR